MEEFEKAFDVFIETREYDKIEQTLLQIVKTGFAAGWEAAGGKLIPPSPVIELKRNDNEPEGR